MAIIPFYVSGKVTIGNEPVEMKRNSMSLANVLCSLKAYLAGWLPACLFLCGRESLQESRRRWFLYLEIRACVNSNDFRRRGDSITTTTEGSRSLQVVSCTTNLNVPECL